jgi:hypothetical protein
MSNLKGFQQTEPLPHLLRPLGSVGIQASVVSLKLLYNDNKGCHSRENGNPAEKTGFPRIKYGAGLIKSGMTFSVKSFLRQLVLFPIHFVLKI